MEYCKGCGSNNIVKNGKGLDGSQRYKCKLCASTYRQGDKRYKYSLEKKLKVIKTYLEGVGIRSIERLEKVSSVLIIYWIRHYAQIIRNELQNAVVPGKIEDIEILEVDELFSYYKKKKIKHTYGLLLTETGIKLLMCK